MLDQSGFQRFIGRQVGRGGVHSIVAAVRSGDQSIDLAAAAGTAAPGGAAMTVDTPYLLASITKMYTAAVVFRLEDEGRLDLGTSIGEYLPDSVTSGIHVVDGVDFGPRITIGQLLDQTSGIADYFEDKLPGGSALLDELRRGGDRELDLDGMVERVRSMRPKFVPGAGDGRKAHYSDTNYRLLGSVVESITGEPLGDTYRSVIFGPLELHATLPYRPQHRGIAAAWFRNRALNIPQFLSNQLPEGGLVAPVAESLGFLRGFFGGRLFDPGRLERQRWNRVFFPMRYGQGLMRFKLPRVLSPFRAPPELIGHSGATGSFAFLNPGRRLYLAGTINQVASPGRPFRLMTQIVDALR